MSTNKTENLGLHSWVETDPVLMSEFNENFGAIDAAAKNLSNSISAETAARNTAINAAKTELNSSIGTVNTSLTDAINAVQAGTLKIATGSYAGDGTGNKTLYVPGTPKFAIVRRNSVASIYNMLMFISPYAKTYNYLSYNDYYGINITWGEDYLYWASESSGSSAPTYALNNASYSYHYIIFYI